MKFTHSLTSCLISCCPVSSSSQSQALAIAIVHFEARRHFNRLPEIFLVLPFFLFSVVFFRCPKCFSFLSRNELLSFTNTTNDLIHVLLNCELGSLYTTHLDNTGINLYHIPTGRESLIL